MKNEHKDSVIRSDRREYQTPKLVVYGDIRHLTAGGTQASGEDDMMMSTNKP